MDNTVSLDLEGKVKNLTASQKENLNLILEAIQGYDAKIGRDEQGRPTLHYKQTQKIYVDPSKANMVARPKTDKDVQQNTAAVLELIDYMKKNALPSGVAFDSTKSSPHFGHYRQGQEFEVTKEILGKGAYGDVVVVKDKISGSENAHKTVMISVFRPEEILAWVDLNEEGFCPSLYLFKLEENKVHIHMEKLENGISLRDIIDEHMDKLRIENPDLIKPFSLCIFHDILDIVQKMNEQGWTHRDLHAGNIMVQKESEQSMKVRVLDFGSAGRLYEQGGLQGFRSDITEVVRKFSALYTTEEFDNQNDTQKNWKEKLKMMTEGLQMSHEDKIELFHLIDRALQIVSPREVQELKDEVKQTITNLNVEKDEIMRQVVGILFPKDGKRVSSADGNVADGEGDLIDSRDIDLLEYYRQQMSIGIYLE